MLHLVISWLSPFPLQLDDFESVYDYFKRALYRPYDLELLTKVS